MAEATTDGPHDLPASADDECDVSHGALFCWRTKGHEGRHWDIEDGYWDEYGNG